VWERERERVCVQQFYALPLPLFLFWHWTLNVCVCVFCVSGLFHKPSSSLRLKNPETPILLFCLVVTLSICQKNKNPKKKLLYPYSISHPFGALLKHL
jgi:hypothetical protein